MNVIIQLCLVCLNIFFFAETLDKKVRKGSASKIIESIWEVLSSLSPTFSLIDFRKSLFACLCNVLQRSVF